MDMFKEKKEVMKNACLLETRIPLVCSRGSGDCCVIFYLALVGEQTEQRTSEQENERSALTDKNHQPAES